MYCIGIAPSTGMDKKIKNDWRLKRARDKRTLMTANAAFGGQNARLSAMYSCEIEKMTRDMSDDVLMTALANALDELATLRPSSLTHVFAETIARKLRDGNFYHGDPTPLGRLAWKFALVVTKGREIQ